MIKFNAVIPVLAFVCLVSFSRCDTAGSENEQSPVILLAATMSNLQISTLSPTDDQSNVSETANINITFNGSLDGATFGTVQIGDIIYENGVNCVMSFATIANTNDRIVVNPDLSFKESSYTGLNIKGFRDAENKTVNKKLDDYNFYVLIK